MLQIRSRSIRSNFANELEISQNRKEKIRKDLILPATEQEFYYQDDVSISLPSKRDAKNSISNYHYAFS